MKKRSFFRSTVSALIAVLIIATAVTGYAWLKTDRETEFRLGTDSQPRIAIKMAVYDETAHAYKWDANWTELKQNHKGGPFGAPLDLTAADGKVGEKAITEALQNQCHFGEIRNLTRIDDSNRAWFCLRIHEQEGLQFDSLRLNYDAIPFAFYAAVWQNGAVKTIVPAEQHPDYKTRRNPATKAQTKTLEQTLNEIYAADGVLKNLMYIEVPKDGLTSIVPPPAAGVNWTAFDVQAGIQDYIRLAADTAGGLSGSTNQVQWNNGNPADPDNGYYYVYFRVSPEKTQYFQLVKNLYAYMPCYLSFENLTVSVNVTTKENAKP